MGVAVEDGANVGVCDGVIEGGITVVCTGGVIWFVTDGFCKDVKKRKTTSKAKAAIMRLFCISLV